MDTQGDTQERPDRALLAEFLKRAMSTTDAKSVNHLARTSGVSRQVVTKVRDEIPVTFAALERISHTGFGWDPDALTEASLGHVDQLPAMGVPEHLVKWLGRRLAMHPPSTGSNQAHG